MALCTNDCKTSCLLGLWGQLNISTTACHVGGNGHCAWTACLSHNLSLLLVQFGVKYVMLNLTHIQHLAKQLRYLHRCGTHKHRAAFSHKSFNFSNNRIIFCTLGLVYAVIHILTYYRTVCRNGYNIKFVDVPELASLRFSCTGHTRQLAVHTEVVLQGDGCKCLCGSLNLNTLLGLNSLVQTVRVAAALHNTASLFIHNLNLAVTVYNVLVILLKESVGFKQLVYSMYTLRFYSVVCHERIVACKFLLFCKILVLKLSKLCAYVRQHKETRVTCIS